MNFSELVVKNRSYRRFYEDRKIPASVLEQLVSLARFVPSGRNMQLLRYIISNRSAENDKIFSTLSWAAYLNSWEGPVKGERPAAYIIVLHDKKLSGTVQADTGIAAQTILLGAVSIDLGGCMIMSVKKELLATLLNIPPEFSVELVIALGYPKETVVIDNVKPDGDIRYWRDHNSVHHVPKRNMNELIVARHEE